MILTRLLGEQVRHLFLPSRESRWTMAVVSCVWGRGGGISNSLRSVPQFFIFLLENLFTVHLCAEKSMVKSLS